MLYTFSGDMCTAAVVLSRVARGRDCTLHTDTNYTPLTQIGVETASYYMGIFIVRDPIAVEMPVRQTGMTAGVMEFYQK